MRIDGRDRVGLVVALLVAAICVRLGVWQLDRLHERRQRNALLLAARARPPLPVDGSLPADSARDRRLVARGVYDYAHERLWHGRSYEGVPGVDLVTPLRLAGGAAVLVDRGWAPSPDAFHVDQPAYREGDSAVVLGLGMLAPRARGDVDPAALRDSVPNPGGPPGPPDRKSTRLNSSHSQISYAGFCLTKKKIAQNSIRLN